jgi:hypothetical protein
MVYTEWPVFRDVLADMAETDTDPEVAAEAGKAVQELDRAASSAG